MTSEATWQDLFAPAVLPRLVLVCLGIWLNAADSLVTATIMPSVARSIGGYAFFAWPVAIYLLGSILGGACAGQFARSRGLRPALFISGAIYAAGCAVGALSTTIAVFLIGRVLQGFGAGLIVGLSYVAINVLFPPTHYRRVMAMLAAIWGIATMLGPLLGGVFANVWPLLFWAFAAQAVIFAFAILWLVPREAHTDESEGIAARTLAILTVAVILNLLAGIVAAPVIAGVLLVAALAALAIALATDTRAPVHLFPRNIAHLGDRAGQGYLAIFLLNASTVGFGIYGAAILQTAYGLTPLVAGYIVGLEAAGWTLTALIVAELPHTSEGFWIRAGATVALIGLTSMIVTLPSLSLPAVIVSATLMGGGFGMFWAFLTGRVQDFLPPQEKTVGASAVPTTQMLGNAVGSAFCGLIANALGVAHGFTQQNALAAAVWIFTLAFPVALFGWFCAWRAGGVVPISAPRTQLP